MLAAAMLAAVTFLPVMTVQDSSGLAYSWIESCETRVHAGWELLPLCPAWLVGVLIAIRFVRARGTRPGLRAIGAMSLLGAAAFAAVWARDGRHEGAALGAVSLLAVGHAALGWRDGGVPVARVRGALALGAGLRLVGAVIAVGALGTTMAVAGDEAVTVVVTGPTIIALGVALVMVLGAAAAFTVLALAVLMCLFALLDRAFRLVGPGEPPAEPGPRRG